MVPFAQPAGGIRDQKGGTRMGFATGKWFWVLSLLVLIAGAGVVWMLLSAQPLRLMVLFDDVGDLKKGDPVVWKTFPIGKVENIEPLVDNRIGVDIAIKEDYARRLSHGATFSLRTSHLLGLIGQNAVEVQTTALPGAPFTEGEKVQGVREEQGSLLEEGKQWTLEKYRLLKDQVSRMIEESKSSAYRAELEEALAKARVLAEEGAQEMRPDAEKFRREHEKDFEGALKKLEEVRDEMSRKGDRAAARVLDEQIARLREMLKS
jgi:hypothetical protein